MVIEREGEQGVHGARRPAALHVRVLEGLDGHGGAEHLDERGRHLEVVERDDPRAVRVVDGAPRADDDAAAAGPVGDREGPRAG